MGVRTYMQVDGLRVKRERQSPNRTRVWHSKGMPEPPYQTHWRRGASLIGGVLALGTLLDAIANALSIVTPLITVVGTLLLSAIWLFAEVILRFFRPRWSLPGGQISRLTRLGLQPRWMIAGSILLLWVPRGIDTLKERAPEPGQKLEPTVEFRRYPQ